MNTEVCARTYTCSPSVSWVQDTGSTLVVDRRTLIARRLYGVEAAVWCSLTFSEPVAKIITYVAQLQSVPLADAHTALVAMLESWSSLGLLEVEEDEGHG
jgi:hypothetical protein